MDETDMAQQQAPATTEAPTMAVPPPPPVPVQRPAEDLAAHFETPAWIGPSRTQSAVPTQRPAPPPEDLRFAPPPPEKTFVDHGHWVKSDPQRRIAGAVLVLASLGAIGALVAAIVSHSLVAVIALVACCFVAVLFRSTLVSSGVITVELAGPRLTVSQGGQRETFALTDPQHLIELVGTPGDAGWRLRLETVDGRIIELTPAHVDPAVLHPAASYYRSVAVRAREDHDRRFMR
jgi:hypothetical protein